ncbi:dihydropteroate synthase [Patiriisocius hiemis]|uniref:dihydropteroate synthase n=1 Tax=Patiriisocius hiemis TaxID=3075604 RepID=A0ABU2YF83_9FLAO|nr:dihydropteroate synthase [Constantimarinum sp. W242]MDT0555910.1 dihydropteroate synthase [Constantimarinum sp. W242]
MGIINVTPDSFYDGGKTNTLDTVLSQAEKMLTDGATFLDIGGYSSRPGAVDISVSEEIKRILPAIEAINNKFPEALLSVDTFRSEVAIKAVEAGATLVNDISGGSLDTKMYEAVARLQVPYILMHMKGEPQTMQSLANYNNIIKEVTYYFSEKINNARKAGINDIVADLGFGFAKNIEQNFKLLNNLEHFKILNIPMLVGVSRKSMIYKSLKITPDQALNGTTALHMFALEKGAKILRAHDVKEAMECITLYNNLKK